jgi:hypothetical protein
MHKYRQIPTQAEILKEKFMKYLTIEMLNRSHGRVKKRKGGAYQKLHLLHM